MKHLKTLPLLLLLFASAVTAFQIGDFYHNAEVIKANSVKIVNDSLIKVNTTIKGYAANAPYAIKTVDVPKASFMSHVKTNLKGAVKKNAWYAAWFASMAAAGWAIDELTGQMSRPVKKLLGRCYFTTAWDFGVLSPSACISAFEKYAAFDNRKVTGISSQSETSIVWETNTPAGNSKGSLYFEIKVNKTTVEPVADDAIYESLAAEMMKDPVAAAQAFMVPDAWPYPYPHIFPDPVKYIPGVSEADEALLDALIKGQLQTTNPSAPNYVTPEKLQQLQTLLSQLQQGITPEGGIGSANDALKNPLTQAQLEETLKKRDAEQKKEADEIAGIDKKPITDAYKDSKLKEEYDKLKERVTDPSKMPQLPPLPAADQIDLPSYKGCQTISMNLFNGVLTFPNPDQCKKLEQVKTGLGYLMYVLTALGIIMELFRRVE